MTEHDAKKLYERATESRSTETGPLLHVRVMGRSRDIALSALDIGTISSDERIREAVAQFMELSPRDLRDTVIERHENGNMTMRPEAVFG